MLIPFSYIYIFLGLLRKIFTPQIRLSAYVICVGNATIGGSGKTQIVKWLIQHLDKKYKIIVVSKAYGGNMRNDACIVSNSVSSDEVGDEAVLLSNYATVIATTSIRKAVPLINKLKPQIVIFDDGMQNPSFHKDLTIMAVSGQRLFGNQRIIPAGPLRQSVESAIQQSDAMIYVHNGSKSVSNFATLQKIMSTLEKKPLIQAQIEIPYSYILNKNTKYLAFAGISDPNSFFELLRMNGYQVGYTRSFPDHHQYSSGDILSLVELSDQLSLSLITTEKDYAKVRKMLYNIDYLPINLAIDQQEQAILLKTIEKNL